MTPENCSPWGKLTAYGRVAYGKHLRRFNICVIFPYDFLHAVGCNGFIDQKMSNHPTE